MSGRDFRADADRYVLHALRRDRRLVFERGKGARLWDTEGNDYLDAISGTNGPAMIGHSHPRLAEEVSRQLSLLPSTFLSHDSVPVVDFARKIGDRSTRAHKDLPLPRRRRGRRSRAQVRHPHQRAGGGSLAARRLSRDEPRHNGARWDPVPP